MDAGLDLCLDLLDGGTRGRGGGSLEEGVDRLHGSVFDCFNGVPVDGETAGLHGVFQVVGRFRFRLLDGLVVFRMEFLDQAVVFGDGRGGFRRKKSVLFEVSLGHAVDRDGDVPTAHLVDTELGSLDGCAGRGGFLDAVLRFELAGTVLILLFGDLLLFDDRFLDRDRFGAVRGHFAALGGFGDDHLSALGYGRRGGCRGCAHFLVRWFLNMGRRQNGVAITEFGVVLFEHGVVVAQTDRLGQKLERRHLEGIVREEVGLELLGELVLRPGRFDLQFGLETLEVRVQIGRTESGGA